jgi:ElaB/YqjD/DUF883 family membrane-anchored ribosome-binding protein
MAAGWRPPRLLPPATTTPAAGTTGTTGTTMPTAGTGTYGEARGPASADAKVTTSGETAQIRAEIEETRASITDTVEEISARLSPKNIVAEATEKTRERVRQFADTASERATELAGQTRHATERAVDSARENPWVAALAVAGIGAAAWWMVSRRDVDDSYGPYDDDFYTEESLYYADDLDPLIYDERTERMESNRMAGATIPLVLAGIGVGAWLWNRQQSARRYESYGSGYPLSASQNSWGDVGYGEEAGSYRSFEGAGSSWGEDASQAADRAKGAVSDAAGRAGQRGERRRGARAARGGDAAERARHAASDAAERARHVANDVGERTRGMAVRARQQVGQAGERAKTQLEHWMEHNPLAVGSWRWASAWPSASPCRRAARAPADGPDPRSDARPRAGGRLGRRRPRQGSGEGSRRRGEGRGERGGRQVEGRRAACRERRVARLQGVRRRAGRASRVPGSPPASFSGTDAAVGN